MSTSPASTRQPIGAILRNGFLTIVIGDLATSVLRFLAVGLLGANGSYPALLLGAILFSTTVALGAATLVRVLLERWTTRAGLNFRRIAIGAYVLSLGGPASIALGNPQFGPASPAIVLTIVLMHTAAAITAFLLLGRGSTDGKA
ncbi:MAG: hypothetical protein H0X24_08980 [Ktedonobacterales bacterium]|nr:hypothetical protein [Ktedonobacterales bacterium]